MNQTGNARKETDNLDDDTFGFDSAGNDDIDLDTSGRNGHGGQANHQQQQQQLQQHDQREEDPNELNSEQKLQLAERANEIYRQQLKYMQDHLASLRSLIQDKENIIENLMLRFDLGIITQDQNRKAGNLSSDEIQNAELRRKAEALAQRTILENFELREMVNELRDENFHLRNEIYELQDKINRQVLQINKLEKVNHKQSQELNALPKDSPTPGADTLDNVIPEPMMGNVCVEVTLDDDAEIYENAFPRDNYPEDEDEDDPPIDHANTEEAQAIRNARQAASHHRKVSSEMPPDAIRGINDSSDDEEEDQMDNEAHGHKRRGSKQYDLTEEEQAKHDQRQQAHHRKVSSVATPDMFKDNYDPEKEARNKAKKFTPEAIEKRKLRAAKRVAKAAKNHVISHRREQSLIEKLLLGVEYENDPDMSNIKDPKKRLQMKKEAEKHQRRKSRQILQEKVGDKGHLSDEDAKDLDDEKGQRYGFNARRDMKRSTAGAGDVIDNKKRPSITGDGVELSEDQKTSDAKGSHQRADSNAPVANLGFEDPDVLLHFEQLKVKDLEKELAKTKDLLDDTSRKMTGYKEIVESAQKKSQDAENASQKSQTQLTEAVTSKSGLAQKCALEIMRLTMVLNTLLQIPKFKNTVQMLIEESYKAKTA